MPVSKSAASTTPSSTIRCKCHKIKANKKLNQTLYEILEIYTMQFVVFVCFYCSHSKR